MADKQYMVISSPASFPDVMTPPYNLKVITNKINPELGNIFPGAQKGWVNMPYQVNGVVSPRLWINHLHSQKDMLNWIALVFHHPFMLPLKQKWVMYE